MKEENKSKKLIEKKGSMCVILRTGSVIENV